MPKLAEVIQDVPSYCSVELVGLGVLPEKTKAEAQALVDAEVTAAQTAWDALPEEQKTDMNPRPTDITLP